METDKHPRGASQRPSKPLDRRAVAAVGREIRLERYLSVSVSNEALVSRVIESYRELTKRPRGRSSPPRRPRGQ